MWGWLFAAGSRVREQRHGRIHQVDEGKATSLANVFACGGAARAAGNVTMAVADGAHRGSMG